MGEESFNLSFMFQSKSLLLLLGEEKDEEEDEDDAVDVFFCHSSSVWGRRLSLRSSLVNDKRSDIKRCWESPLTCF